MASHSDDLLENISYLAIPRRPLEVNRYNKNYATAAIIFLLFQIQSNCILFYNFCITLSYLQYIPQRAFRMVQIINLKYKVCKEKQHILHIHILITHLEYRIANGVIFREHLHFMGDSREYSLPSSSSSWCSLHLFCGYLLLILFI